MTNKILSEKLIKRDYSSLSIKNEWFWGLINKDAKEVEIISRNAKNDSISSVFDKDKVIIFDYRNTGIYIISSLRSSDDEMPFCYHKTEPLFLPIAICALPNNLDLNKAETLPLHSVLSALESLKIDNKSTIANSVLVKL